MYEPLVDEKEAKRAEISWLSQALGQGAHELVSLAKTPISAEFSNCVPVVNVS